MAQNSSNRNARLPPEVNRILFVRNLPFKITSDELYDIFGNGNASDTRGTAFVVYDDIFDAKNACEHLSGFNVMGRYLIVLYFQPNKMNKKRDLNKMEQNINALKGKFGME